MPRRLLRDGLIVADEWETLPGDADGVPDVGPPGAPAPLVPFERWSRDHDAWCARGGRLGVVVGPAHAVELLVPDLALLSVIAADFGGPGEGRGYTQARLLRERWRFTGELRAVGYVRRDQLFFMARCGFNAFELPDHEIDAARAALSTFSFAYQPSNDAGMTATVPRRWPAP